MKLIDTLLLEANISDTITSRTEITYNDLIVAILDTKDKAYTINSAVEISKTLDITPASLKRYITAAQKAKFIKSDGSIESKYTNVDADDADDDTSSNDTVVTGGKISQSLDSKITKFKAPKVANNNTFSNQIFKMLSLMDGQSAKSGVKNSLMLTGDPGVGKCLCGDQEIVIDVNQELFDKIMEKRKINK